MEIGMEMKPTQAVAMLRTLHGHLKLILPRIHCMTVSACEQFHQISWLGDVRGNALIIHQLRKISPREDNQTLDC